MIRPCIDCCLRRNHPVPFHLIGNSSLSSASAIPCKNKDQTDPNPAASTLVACPNDSRRHRRPAESIPVETVEPTTHLGRRSTDQCSRAALPPDPRPVGVSLPSPCPPCSDRHRPAHAPGSTLSTHSNESRRHGRHAHRARVGAVDPPMPPG